MLENYLKAKENGVARVVRQVDDFIFVLGSFNPTTGERLPDTGTVISRESVEQQLAIHREAIENLKALIADMDSLTE